MNQLVAWHKIWGLGKTGIGRFPSQRASNMEIWCFFVASLDRLLKKLFPLVEPIEAERQYMHQ